VFCENFKQEMLLSSIFVVGRSAFCCWEK